MLKGLLCLAVSLIGVSLSFAVASIVIPSMNVFRRQTDGTTDCDGAKRGPKNSYEYLNDDDDVMEFLSALSSGMPLSLFRSPHSKPSPFPEI